MRPLKSFFAPIKNIKVRRWHAELLLLGFLLIPIMFFILWLQQATSGVQTDAEVGKNLLLGVAAGVLGQAIWFLGVSVLGINLMKDMLDQIKAIREELSKNKPD